MRLYAFLGVLILFSSTPVFAEPTDDAKKAECIAFYDEKKAESNFEYQINNQEKIKELDKAGKRQEAYELAFKPYKPIFEIADRGLECGEYDERFFEERATICLGYMRASDEWRKLFDNIDMPFPYCEESLARGNGSVMFEYLIFYSRGDNAPKDYKKAVSIVDDFARQHPEHDDARFFTINHYRKGGFGLEKDDTKAFNILKETANKNLTSQIPCELSLYYRDGIGITQNEEEADKWLSIYEENNPDKECEFSDMNFLFEASPLEKALLEEGIEK